MSTLQTRLGAAATAPRDRTSISTPQNRSTVASPLQHADPRIQFASVLRDAGFQVEDVESDGGLHRVRMEGDRTGQRSGWYVLHADAIAAGAFGDWKTGESHTWRAQGGRLSLTERERMWDGIAAARRQHDDQREHDQRLAQEYAHRLWGEAARPELSHPYLVAKHVQPHGIRQRDDVLLVPVRDADGDLWSLQTIRPDGSKRFLARGRKHGLYHAIGGKVSDVLAIAEGYATAATIYEATGYPVAVAFDCGNLVPVARVLREKYPDARMIICADDDAGTQERTGRNPGRDYAEQAARAVNGTVALPEFAR